MSDEQIMIQELRGEILLLQDNAALDWAMAEMDFWRAKYLREHPEMDTWEKIETARQNATDDLHDL